MTEAELQRAILLACSRGDTRLFRNNVGVGWAGWIVEHTPARIVLANPRPLHAGLHVGSSDLIGWTTGGLFVSIEVKTGTGRLSADQRVWLDQVRGRAGVARSVEDAQAIIGGADIDAP